MSQKCQSGAGVLRILRGLLIFISAWNPEEGGFNVCGGIPQDRTDELATETEGKQAKSIFFFHVLFVGYYEKVCHPCGGSPCLK